MKKIFIYIYDRNSCAYMSDTIVISDESENNKIIADKKRIEKRRDEIFATVLYDKYFYQVLTSDELTEEELLILEELDLEIE